MKFQLNKTFKIKIKGGFSCLTEEKFNEAMKNGNIMGGLAEYLAEGLFKDIKRTGKQNSYDLKWKKKRCELKIVTKNGLKPVQSSTLGEGRGKKSDKEWRKTFDYFILVDITEFPRLLIRGIEKRKITQKTYSRNGARKKFFNL